MSEKMIIDAYCRIRTIDNTISDDVLDFMKDAAIEKLRIQAVVGQSEQLPPNPITDKEYKDLMKALYPKDNSKRFRR